MRFSIVTHGCKINQYESQRLREGLCSRGGREVPFGEAGTDLVIVNTCTVTHRSDAENRKVIRKGLRLGARVVATGCQAVVFPSELEALGPEVCVVPPDGCAAVLDVDVPETISAFADHVRAFVKVQQGCNNFCTYCIVPYARGLPVSRDPGEIVREINGLHVAGYQEVVLTGINIGLYEGGLSRLLRHILDETDVPRIRLSSVEPWTVEDSLLEMLASEPRLCPHLHLPLQSGSDRILAAMGRPYLTGYYRNLIARVRDISGQIALGSDVMVGFPGEDEQAFQEGLALLTELDLNYLHVFPYSPRPGTPAAGFPAQVPSRVKQVRAARLRQLSQDKLAAFTDRLRGTSQNVLVTQVGARGARGITGAYVFVDVALPAIVGEIREVILPDDFGRSAEGVDG